MASVINPGNIVVPLSVILNQLQGKLSSGEIDALLFAVLGRTRNDVQPGDLITADLFNQIRAEVADLQIRVTQLEGNIVSTPTQLVLTRPVNGTQVRVGEELSIEGSNLGFSAGSSVVTLGGVLANDFRPGSNNERLIVRVPGVGSLDPAGTSAVLVVSNGASSAQRTLLVRPAQDLSGAIDVSWTGVSPNPIAANASVRFDFLLRSRANLNASYQIVPTISRVANASAWQNGLTVSDQNGGPLEGNRLPVPAGGEGRVRINLAVPQGTQNATFALSVAAQAGNVIGSTGRMRLSVGNLLALPDPNFTLGTDAVAFTPANSGSFVRGTESDSISLNAGGTAIATVVARVTQAGNYLARIVALNSPEAPTTNWTVERHPQDPAEPGQNPVNSLFQVTQQQLDQAGGAVSISPRFRITRAQNASTAGEAEIVVERQGSGFRRGIIVSLTAT